MRAADVVTALALAALGGLVLFDALRLGIGWGSDRPRSGFFPFWLAVLLIASCGAIVVQALARVERRREFVSREALVPVLKMLAPAAAFVIVTQGLGLYVASAAYLALYMRWIGRHSWTTVAVTGVGFSVVAFVIFETWFLVPMPKGPLETWLGY